MRLGLLQDAAAIDRQIEREAAEASSKRRAALSSGSVPTVLTEAETKAAEEKAKKEKKDIGEKVRSEEKKKEAKRIRPLTEAKAIDSGATFISESFLFMVAAGLIGFETWRSRRKTEKTRTAADERMEGLEEALKKEREERERDKEERLKVIGVLEEVRAQMRVMKTEAEKLKNGNGTHDVKPVTAKVENAGQKKEDAKDKKTKPPLDAKHKPPKLKEKQDAEKHEGDKKPVVKKPTEKKTEEKQDPEAAHSGS